MAARSELARDELDIVEQKRRECRRRRRTTGLGPRYRLTASTDIGEMVSHYGANREPERIPDYSYCS